jgi:copper chaperone CopZ
MNAHTVTVTFDDEVTNLAAIVSALGEAGYTVPRNEKLE